MFRQAQEENTSREFHEANQRSKRFKELRRIRLRPYSPEKQTEWEGFTKLYGFWELQVRLPAEKLLKLDRYTVLMEDIHKVVPKVREEVEYLKLGSKCIGVAAAA